MKGFLRETAENLGHFLQTLREVLTTRTSAPK
jgi:hypothetical protein